MANSTAGEQFTVRFSDTAHQTALTERVGEDCTVRAVGSTGRPELEPLGTVTSGGRTALYADHTTEQLGEVISACLAESAVDAGGPLAVVDHGTDQRRFPLPPSLAGRNAVLGGCGWRRPTSPGDHEDAGGFADADPGDVLGVGETLAGRGWTDVAQDEPVANQWRRALSADGDPVVIVNGHGTRADRLLLESAPFEVLDGANALADALGATRVIVYIAGADERARRITEEAAGEFPDPEAPIETVAGQDIYRAGEPTMAIEDIEGNHRLEARRRPPGPATFGLDGRPTPVHSPRTLAQLSVGLREGVPETRLVAVEGDVSAPAVVELGEEASLEDALGAVELTDDWKAASVGGQFGGVTDSLSIQPDHESLTAAGLGTDGVVNLLGEGRCVLEFIGKRAAFAADSNCGRCVPCREGTTQLAELLREIYDSEFDRAKIEELVAVMATTSLCEFGVAAARPARTALEAFEDEIEAHADGHCPAGRCLDPIEAQP